MKIDKTFVLRLTAVFIATLITVGTIQAFTNYYGQGSVLITLILAILVARVYDDLIDPRRKRGRNAKLLVMQHDLDALKSEIEFLKYYIHKTSGVDLGEINLEASIWQDMEADSKPQEDDENE